MGYFCCVLLLSITLYYYTDVFYDALDRGDDNPLGSISGVYNITRCVNGPKNNEEKSLLTFLSEDGFMEGIAIFLCKHNVCVIVCSLLIFALEIEV